MVLEVGGNGLNEKAKILLQNLRYAVSANFFVLGISIVLNLFIPKFIGVKDYSLWQLYIFYSSYVVFFHLGWLDGIYLKVGGEDYGNLNKRSIGSQFWYFTIYHFLIASFFIFYAIFFLSDSDRYYILIFTVLNLIIINCRNFIQYILQSTNRIREYAQISRGDRYLYVICVGIYVFFGGDSFKPLMLFDIISKFCMLLVGMIKTRDMLFIKLIPLKCSIIEIKENIKSGSNLMFSYIASTLILGISRLIVEHQWSIETFGKLSFTLSISNMFMTFINAVGVVIFPLLRRTNEESLPSLYVNIRTIFVPVTYGLLLFFVPIKILLAIWLPEYSESLIFMGILLPMIVYEGRMALLVSTYLKTIRKERLLLLANLVTLTITVFLSYIAGFLLKNIYLTILVILISLAFRCIFTEKILLNVMKIRIGRITIYETILTSIFVISNVFLTQSISFILYASLFLGYLIAYRRKIKKSAKILYMYVKK